MPSVRHPSYIIYFAAAFFSILLSTWISSQETVINPDAICYLQSAATMKQGLRTAMNLCDQAKWPFYSLLIASVVNAAKLSYVTAAYVLNGLFSLLTVLAFLGIVATITKNQRILWLSALVILLAHGI